MRPTANSLPTSGRCVGSRLRPVVAVAGLLLTVFAASVDAQELWIPTGPTEFREQDPPEGGWWELLDAARYERYAELTRGRGPALDDLPPLSDGARFGIKFYFDETNRHFVVDVGDDGGYILHADLNANDSLLDDPPRELDLEDGYHTTRFVTFANETWEGQERTYPLQLQLFIRPDIDPDAGAGSLQFLWDVQTLRRGEIHVDDAVTQFAVFGHLGVYGTPFSAVWFDLDGDGRGWVDPKSDERFLMRDETVTIDGRAYAIRVDRYGDQLILNPLGEVVERPSIAIGSVAPDFLVQDIDGREHRLSDYRGKVVLLDFFAIWCVPCMHELFHLTDVYSEYHGSGFEIIGIAPDETTRLREFQSESGLPSRRTFPIPTWPIIQEDSTGKLHRLYRVRGYPTHYVVGTDGTIIGGRIDRNTFEDELKQALGLPD